MPTNMLTLNTSPYIFWKKGLSPKCIILKIFLQGMPYLLFIQKTFLKQEKMRNEWKTNNEKKLNWICIEKQMLRT
jgi:hypothetical protein